MTSTWPARVKLGLFSSFYYLSLAHLFYQIASLWLWLAGLHIQAYPAYPSH